ncbi:PTS sugar transporter subunit IIC [Vagococcus entomophilus]|uniref:Permease IIC component n=1 Tax=Vagococcus entomophilus TaxID=1160095 RepID=A0A430AL14_9ENTE|nr:PTS sugar transporter subunit IIC [Vagococcus entomophilus]RSU08756.1 oligo-beta-mannoside permease IIC protein [Vagococcus entomophilus]
MGQTDTFLDKFSNKLMPIAEKLNQNRYLAAIRDGFFACMSIIIIGSMFLIFPNFPYQGFIDFMNSIFGDTWILFCNRAYDMSVNIMTIFVIIGISRSLAKFYKVDSISAVISSLTAFFILTPTITDSADKASLGLPMANFGAAGLFLGIISTILACEIVRLVLQRGWKIKMPDSVPENVSKSFEALIPAVFVIVIYLFIFFGFRATPYGTAHNFIFKILQTPLTSLGSTLPATLIVQVLATLLFSFGLHGPNIVGSVMTPIWTALTVENSQAFKAGTALPNIINAQFDANYVKLGGCGTTIGLAILLLFFAKSKQFKALGKLSFAPSIFNINEPLIFGFPIVLNPIMMIPFILSPIIFASLTYFVVNIGLVPIANGINIPWTMPPILAGLFIGGWRGAVWQVVEILLSIAWYYPFFKMADAQSLKTESEMSQ